MREAVDKLVSTIIPHISKESRSELADSIEDAINDYLKARDFPPPPPEMTVRQRHIFELSEPLGTLTPATVSTRLEALRQAELYLLARA